MRRAGNGCSRKPDKLEFGIPAMPSDSTSTTNPFPTRADFTYSITPTKLVIKDTGKGAKTVVEDLPAVLRRIEYWHQGSVAHLELTVVDAEGRQVAT
jgi:hypothetical protein